MRRYVSCLLLGGLLFFPMEGKAVVFYSTGDPAYNTNAPIGDLEGSGWQFQGRFAGYLGTPIAPHHFITAKHISGSWVPDGTPILYAGKSYSTRSRTHDPTSDLTLWEIDGTFESYAPVYSGKGEQDESLVVMGRGVDRGIGITNTVTTGNRRNPIITTVTIGWEWGAYNYTQRWGSNAADVVTDDFIISEWNAEEGSDECMLTDKDSGGAVFMKLDGKWQLAGINYAVAPGGTFSFHADGSGHFNGAIFNFDVDDTIYVGQQWNGSEYETWTLLPSTQKSAFYATRVSSRYDWITNNIPDFDQDVDGLPDWWESLYGTGPTSLDREGHDDSDGFTNYEEWLADTDPTDGSSLLEILDSSTETNLVFSSSTNRKYQVEYRTTLAGTNEDWAVEVLWFNGASPQTEQSVSTVSSNRFYRVRAKLR